MAETREPSSDTEAVVAAALDYFEGLYLHLVRTRDGWKIANTLWQPS